MSRHEGVRSPVHKRIDFTRKPKHRMPEVGDVVLFNYYEDRVMRIRIVEITNGEWVKGENAEDVWDTRPVYGMVSEMEPV